MASPAMGLARLRAAAESGELDALCARHRVRVLTVFGSVARGEPAPHDLDVGALFEPDTNVDYPAVIGDLIELTGSDVDLVNLNSGGPVIRERALVGAIALYESEPGALSRAATAAALLRMDTDWMRRACGAGQAAAHADVAAQARPFRRGRPANPRGRPEPPAEPAPMPVTPGAGGPGVAGTGAHERAAQYR